MSYHIISYHNHNRNHVISNVLSYYILLERFCAGLTSCKLFFPSHWFMSTRIWTIILNFTKIYLVTFVWWYFPNVCGGLVYPRKVAETETARGMLFSESRINIKKTPEKNCETRSIMKYVRGLFSIRSLKYQKTSSLSLRQLPHNMAFLYSLPKPNPLRLVMSSPQEPPQPRRW